MVPHMLLAHISHFVMQMIAILLASGENNHSGSIENNQF